MKVFFGVNVTEDKTNTTLDGEGFVTHRITEDQQKKLQDNEKVMETVKAEAELPVILKIIRFIALIGIFFSIRLLADVLLGEISFGKLMLNAPWFIPMAIACVAAYILIAIAARKRVRRVADDDRVQKDIENMEAAEKAALGMLGVPEGADEADILICKYKVKNGRVVLKGMLDINFANVNSWVFINDGALCFADVTMRATIPLECITGIRTVKKRVILSNWHKNTPHNKGEFKEYRIVMNENHPVIRQYHALCITCDGEDYELYFPSYELPVIERLTGLRAYE